LAARCKHDAEQAENQEFRGQLLSMAERWDLLASETERAYWAWETPCAACKIREKLLKKAREYAHHGHECRVLARNAQSEDHRVQLLAMAEIWDRLSSDRARLLRQHPSLKRRDKRNANSRRPLSI
jgi:hypothetical protein